jgi:ubiquinone/menaquinone biosynthesis C-methylase UbiE
MNTNQRIRWTARLWWNAAAVACVAAAAASLSAGQLSSRPAAEWTERLERPDRVASLKIDYIIASLALKPGETVADIGAGPGIISVPMAQAVGPKGKVYAEDIDEGFFEHIKKKADAAKVTNVTTVLGGPSDPKLPKNDVDVALFHDVLHHIDDRAGFIKSLGKYMKKNGRIGIVELPATGSHKDEPKLIVSKEQAKEWMASIGFKPVQEFDGLDGKWFVVYGRS